MESLGCRTRFAGNGKLVPPMQPVQRKKQEEEMPDTDNHEHAEFLNFITTKGYDLELTAASDIKAAGFWIGQSLGVVPWKDPPIRGELPRANTYDDEPISRELDIVAMHSSEHAAFLFAVECKTFRKAQVGVLVAEHDSLTPTPPDVLMDGKYKFVLGESVADFAIATDCRAFRLISKPLDDRNPNKKESGYDPAWNALRQVLDGADDVATLPLLKKFKFTIIIPLIVIDSKIIRVAMDNGKLTASEIQTAVVRVAAHKSRPHRDVYVVQSGYLKEFAKISMQKAIGLLAILEQSINSNRSAP